MGNEQSAPTPRRRPPNRLSKPRTNNHSTANLLDKRASAPPSRRNSLSTSGSPTKNRDNAIPVNAPREEVIEDRKEVTSRRRMSLFRSKSAKPQAQSQTQKLEVNTDVDRSSVEPSPIDQPSHRWSREPRTRGNSVTTQSSRSSERPYSEPPTCPTKPPMRSRMSLQTYTHHPRLSLVAELPSPQPDKTNPIRRLSRYGEEESQPLTQASRTNSESALYTPIRRRSLLQHGVATRTSFVESDPRSSLPSQIQSADRTPPRRSIPQDMSDDMRDYYYNPSKPTSSPLSDLVLLGPSAEFAGIGPRTETPTELEHIGAFKLGTLRITNGAASPVPSFKSAEDDYIAAGNARRSQEADHAQDLRSNTLLVPVETRKAPWIVRTESPLRQTHELEHKPLTIETQLPLTDPSLAWFDFKDTEKLLRSFESPTKALELARDYQQDLALSPFSFDNSPLPSPRLESTSKNTAIEDDLFEAEPGTPNLSERAPRSFDSAYDSGFAPPKRMIKGPRDLPPKPLAKADSGYSSNISLRSFKRNSVQLEEVPPTPPKESNSRIPSNTYSVDSVVQPTKSISRVPSSTYSVTSVASADSDITLRMKQSLPSLPPTEPAPPPPVRQAPAPPLSPTVDCNKEVPNPPTPDKDTQQIYLAVPAKQQRRKSLPAQARNVREESPAGSELSTVSSNSSSRWSSKSKISKRPQSVQPPKPDPVFTVQAFRSLSEHLRIPPPSFEARRHLEERVETFPVACFPNTYPGHVGLRHSSSKETLGTIFSVGSAEVRDELNFARLQSALPPVPVEPSIPEHPVREAPKPQFNRRNTFQVSSSVPVSSADTVKKESRWGRRSIQMPKVRDKSLPRVRERSLPRLPRKAISNEDLEEHLTSYSTISSSLGKSPYELAANTIARQPTPNSRAKSMTAQFEAEAAARFNVARTNNNTQTQPQQTPSPISRMRSYDSMNSKGSDHTRQKSREHPPQTHTNNSPWRPQAMQMPTSQSPLAAHPPQLSGHGQQQQQYFPQVDRVDVERRYSNSPVSKAGKSRAPPPVSMTTQRKALPSSLRSQVAPPQQAQIQNQEWSKTANAWSSRANSAMQLQTRKSMELQSSSMQELRSRKSMDGSQHYQIQARSSQMQLKGWNVGVGYEDAHTYPSLPRQWTQSQTQEYDHSFGTSTHSDKENHHHSQSQYFSNEEYYDSNAHENDVDLSHQIHQRKTSTSEMLVLDRFSGGLDYGFERGLGLVGSAGTGGGIGRDGVRKSLGVSERWGVDLSDVPVILRRVRVEG